ncbi:SpoIIE family protein phosphatase [Cryomorpha ignava]|uniref:SpoIIE family protein phosphatase n=1 Tax=Cryomorpha ignava TaxID=101383 RepID=A0A7K3WVB3_9FLAO|nr:SpoIIE family protein phosphatase [Cryomorpha ignava]NEN25468.1 SpoIIE family protein phosphatase [Cryomorpha ignava]
MKVKRLQERLKQRDFKLKTLLEITKAINDNLSTEGLLKAYREIVEKELLIGRLALFIKQNDDWNCAVFYGVDKGFSESDIIEKFQVFKDIKTIQSDNEEHFKGFGLIIPVFHNDKPLAYVLIGDINDDELKMSPIIKHMRYIQTLTNIICVAIENKQLIEKSLEQERYKTELKLAAEMQALMVGSGRRDYPSTEVATYYKPHHQVGGDFCDFIELNSQESFFCVADVSGKGISAAFLMANIQAHLRALLQYTNWTLESLAIELNKKVVETVNGERFVTLFMAYFHRPSRTLHYLNAGHNPPVLLSNNKIHHLESGSVGIGMLEELPFINKSEIKIGKDAMIVCYTDGVVEIEDAHEEEFGYERIGQLMKDNQHNLNHIDDLITHIISSLDSHRGNNPYFDDTALLCCRFK